MAYEIELVSPQPISVTIEGCSGPIEVLLATPQDARIGQVQGRLEALEQFDEMLQGPLGADNIGTEDGDSVQEALDEQEQLLEQRAAHVATLAALDNVSVNEGQTTIADEHKGGEFLANDVADYYADALAEVRFEPFRPAYLYLSNLGQPPAGAQFTIDGQTFTYVAAAGGTYDILIGATVADTAKNTRDKINASGIAFKADGGTDLTSAVYTGVTRVRYNVGGPVGNGKAVSVSDPALAWSTNGNNIPVAPNPPITAFVGGSPADGDWIELGPDHRVILRAADADPADKEVLIGANSSVMSLNFRVYVNGASATLGLTATDLDPSTFLKATTPAGLERLRTMRKLGSTINLKTTELASDRQKIVYRPSVASPAIMHARRGVDKDGNISPAMWDIRGGGLDTVDITDAVQAMVDFNHFNEQTTIQWGAYVIPVSHPILIRNNRIIASGGWLINENDASEYDASCTCIGVGHPGFDDDIAVFAATATIPAGAVSCTLVGGGYNFKPFDVVVIMGSEGDQQNTNLWQRKQRFQREILSIDGNTLYWEKPLQESIDNAVVGIYGGVIDATTGFEICVAKRPYMRGLSFESLFGACMIRCQPYDVNLEIPQVRCTRGLFPNAFSGYCRINLLEFQLKAWEFAHSAERGVLEIDNLVFRPGGPATPQPLPIGKWGENSNDVTVISRQNNLMAWDRNVALFNFENVRRARLELGQTEIGNLTTDIVSADAYAVVEHDAPVLCNRINLALGRIRYTAAPGGVARLFGFTNSAGYTQRIDLEQALVEGPEPTGVGMLIEANNCRVSERVKCPGSVKVTGNDNHIRGHFSKGYDATSAGLRNDLQITSDAWVAMRKQDYDGVSNQQLLATRRKVSTLTVPANTWKNADQLEVEVRYRTTGSSGIKSINMEFAGAIEGTLNQPAASVIGGVAKFNLMKVANNSMLLEGHLEGQNVQISSVEAPAAMDTNDLVIDISSHVATAGGESITIYQIRWKPQFRGHREG